MTEKETLELEAKALIESYHQTPQYRRYQALKEAIRQDRRLQDLLLQSDQLKQSARFLDAKERKEALAKAKAMFDTYQEDPLVINLKAAKKELELMLEPLTQVSLGKD